MKIKIGDKVKVITGTNKGKEGKVSKVLRKENRVIVEGVNIVKKHVKPGRTNETGGILETEAPIHISNVKVLTKEEKKETKKESKKSVETKTDKDSKKKTEKSEKESK
ncbi:MAG: 50S ribosomal protein L24 [Bacilli bacterium]|nr:50S ribosomal protein L24 [Bacilli bacterium]